MAELEGSSFIRARKVLMGTCGWSDQTLLKCGRFYPASVRSAEDRLRHYSTHFPCVEVDTSTYAIPSIASIKGWLRCIPRGFLFHFKAFGFFCSKSCALTGFPVHIRAKVSVACPGKDYIYLNTIPESLRYNFAYIRQLYHAFQVSIPFKFVLNKFLFGKFKDRDELWQFFNTALHVVHAAGNLGVVVFQFHLTFKPTKENQAHVEWCRKKLDPCFSMAAEFRCRDWFNDQHLLSTTTWLKQCGIALVAADELRHETFQKDREQTGLPKGQERVTLPVAWALTNPDFMYVRVHRREGCQRLLSEAELLFWVTHLMADLPQELKGPIYFMWGTDWEDQPIINAKCLNDKLADMAFDWKAAHQLTASKSMLDTYFGQKAHKQIKCASMSVESAPMCNMQERIVPNEEKLHKEIKCASLSIEFMPVCNMQERIVSNDEELYKEIKCACMSIESTPVCITQKCIVSSDEKLEWWSESSKADGLITGGYLESQTLSTAAILSSNKKHSQDFSAFLGIRKMTKNTGKQKSNASTKKVSSSITTYFQKSSSS